MHVLLFAATLLALPCGLAAADAIGEWTLEYDFQGTAVPGTMSITSDGDGLSGTWTDQNGESKPLRDVAYEDGTITFVRDVDYEGTAYELTFTGKIDGDSLTGEFETPAGALATTGSRGGGDAVDPATLIGKWNTVTISDLGTLEAQIEVDKDLKGWYRSDDAEYELKNLVLKGSTLTFDMTFSFQDTELELAFEGTISGRSLTGQFTSDLGVGEVTAQKVWEGDAGDVMTVITTIMAALASQDIDAMVAPYSEDFTSDQGGGVAETKEFLVGAKDQGFLEDLEVSMSNIEISVDGDKASVENIELEGAFGALTLSFELAKRDGTWLVTYQAQY